MTAIVFYSLFLFLGAVVSYEDWREKKIRNRWIVLGALACGAGLAWFLGNSVLGARHRTLLGLGTYYLPWPFYLRVALHLSLSLAAALTLWWMSIWPAGDAKFFTLLSLFAVLVDPNLPGFPQVLFLLLLVNIFVPAGLIFAGETLVKVAGRIPDLWNRASSERALAEVDRLGVRCRELWPYRFDYAMVTVNLFALFLLIQSAMPSASRFVTGPLATLVLYALVSVAWRGISAVLRKKAVGVAALVGLSAWALSGALLWHWDVGARVAAAVKLTLNFWVFLSFGRGLFTWFIERESLRDAAPAHLRHGVVLSDDSWRRIVSEGEISEEMGERYSDGISEDEAVTLRGWLESKGIANLTVYHTIPFALWIFFGTLLTVSRGCNVVAVLVHRFGWARDLLHAALLKGAS